jgi:hypothetical protein
MIGVSTGRTTGSTLGIERGETVSGFTGGALLGLDTDVVVRALACNADLLTGTSDGEVA